MGQSFTREELFELVWSEPITALASRFKLSDVGFAKACKRADISRPPRGHWAKLAAGKKVSQAMLSVRGPGMSNEVRIGQKNLYHNSYSEKEILEIDLQAPIFEDTIEIVSERVRALIPPVTIPRFPERAHIKIRKFLDADDERRKKQQSSSYSFSWDAPLFDDAFEKRRLRVLNAVLTALEKAGMRPTISGRDARSLDVAINDTHVQFSLDAATQKEKSFHGGSVWTRGTSKSLRLQILSGGWSSNARIIWEDQEKNKLENHLTDIVVELIISGERRLRAIQQHQYEWMVERKIKLVEEIKKRKEEAEKKERERLIALEQARIDRLLGDATAFRQANDIRSFITEVSECLAETDGCISNVGFDDWCKWANAQADRIDPVRSGKLLGALKDED